MRITILAIGSRGDVQPLVALALGLRSEGYNVAIATHSVFEGFVRGFGLGFLLIKSDPKKTLESRAGQEALKNGSNPFRSWLNFSRMIKPSFIQTGLDCLNACRGSDIIVYSPFSAFFATHVSEKLKIPAVAACLAPAHPTRQIPSWFSPGQGNLGGAFNLFSWKMYNLMNWLPLRAITNELRSKYFGLPPLGIKSLKNAQQKKGLPKENPYRNIPARVQQKEKKDVLVNLTKL